MRRGLRYSVMATEEEVMPGKTDFTCDRCGIAFKICDGGFIGDLEDSEVCSCHTSLTALCSKCARVWAISKD